MSLTVLTLPENYQACKSMMPLEVSSDDYIETNGSPHITLWQVQNTDAADGESITFTFNNISVTLTYRDNVIKVDGKTIRTHLSGTVNDFIDEIIKDVTKNLTLDQHFSFASDNGGTIVVTSKTNNPSFNLIIEENVTGQAFISSQDAEAKKIRTGYQVMVNVFVEENYNSGDFKLAFSRFSNTVDGKMRFNLAAGLDDLLAKINLLPEYGLDDVQLLDPQRRYNLEFAEGYGVPLVHYLKYSEGPFITLRAGMDPYEFAHFDFVNHDFLSQLSGKFMTDFKSRQVFLDQKLFLSIKTTYDFLQLYANFQFEDGTELSGIKLFQVELEIGRVYSIPAGADQLNLPSYYTGSKLVYYDLYAVEIFSENPFETSTSETVGFDVVNFPTPDRLDYAFENNYGVMDYLCLFGIITHSESRERDDQIKPNQHDRLAVEAIISQRTLTKTTGWKQNTGFRLKDEMPLMNQLVGSEKVYIDSGDGWRPVVSLSTKIEIKKSKSFLQSADLEFKLANQSINQTTVDLCSK